jgi:hypothetical protein
MNNTDVKRLLDECEDDIKTVRTIVDLIGQTSNIVPYLNKYSIIRACGTIEVAYKTLVADFCNWRSKAQIKNYIDNNVRDSSRNPTYSNMCRLLDSFDEEWNDNFKSKINALPDVANIHLSLTSLVDARNDFAHGGNPSMTVKDVLDKYAHCKKVIEEMDSIIQ